HQGQVFDATFSPDGKTLLTGGGWVGRRLGQARLWDVDTARVLGTAAEHAGLVLAVAYRQDGKAILTGSEDGKARLWDLVTGQTRDFPHKAWVHAVAFSPDGKFVLTGGGGKARMWSADTGKEQGLLPPGKFPLPHGKRLFAMAFSPKEDTILTVGDTA